MTTCGFSYTVGSGYEITSKGSLKEELGRSKPDFVRPGSLPDRWTICLWFVYQKLLFTDFSMSKGLGKVIGRVSEASKITTVSTSTYVRGADC